MANLRRIRAHVLQPQIIRPSISNFPHRNRVSFLLHSFSEKKIIIRQHLLLDGAGTVQGTTCISMFNVLQGITEHGSWSCTGPSLIFYFSVHAQLEIFLFIFFMVGIVI